MGAFSRAAFSGENDRFAVKRKGRSVYQEDVLGDDFFGKNAVDGVQFEKQFRQPPVRRAVGFIGTLVILVYLFKVGVCRTDYETRLLFTRIVAEKPPEFLESALYEKGDSRDLDSDIVQ